MRKQRKPRKQLTDVQKIECAHLVVDKGMKVKTAAMKFGVSESSVYLWKIELEKGRKSSAPRAAKKAAAQSSTVQPYIGPAAEKKDPVVELVAIAEKTVQGTEDGLRCLLYAAEVESLKTRIACLEAMILAG